MSDADDPAEPGAAAEGASASAVPLEDMADEKEQQGEDAAAAPPADDGRAATDLESVFDVPVHVSAVLGKTHLPVASLMNLSKGAIVELDRKVGEAIDIYVNNRLVARGEVVIVEDRLGVTMTEIVKNDQLNA